MITVNERTGRIRYYEKVKGGISLHNQTYDYREKKR